MTFGTLAKWFSWMRPKPKAEPGRDGIQGIKTFLPRVGDDCFSIIKHFESCLKPIGDDAYTSYADPGYGWEVPTIGWGTTRYENGKKVGRGDVIDQARADALLRFEVYEKADAVKAAVKVPLTDYEFDALTSFAYNVGTGALRGSTLLRKLNAGDRIGAGKEFVKWNRSNGIELDGLTRRRLSEARLFRGERKFIVTMDEFKRMNR